MKKLPKIIFALMLGLLLSFSLSSCREIDDKDKEKDTEVVLNVSEAIEAQNGKKVIVEGIIFYKNSDGFYLYSDNDYLYCSSSKLESNTLYKIGDKVKVTGYLSFFDSFTMLTNLKDISIISSDNNALIINTTILAINNLEKTNKYAYSMYVSLKGKVIKDNNKFYLVDAIGNNIEVLNEIDENKDKIINANYVISSYDNGFKLERTSDAIESEYDIDDISSVIEYEIESKISSVIYNKLDLINESSIDGVTYEYSLSDENLSASNYTQVTEKKNVTLNVKAKYKNEEKAFKKELTLMPSTAISINEFVNNKPRTNYQVVKATGTVIAKLSNSSMSVYTLIVKDNDTDDTIALVFRAAKDESGKTLSGNIGVSNSKFTSVKVGNTITFKARYNTTGDYKNTFDGVTSLDRTTDIKDININYDSAISLDSFESYSRVASNFEDYFGKLIKFENPYLSYSGSNGTISNWIIPSYTLDETAIYNSVKYEKTTVDSKTQESITTLENKVMGFHVLANSSLYGDSSWYSSLDLPGMYNNNKLVNVTIYCYFVPSTGSYLQLVIPSKDYYITDSNEDDDFINKLNNSIDQSISHYAYQNTTYTLPTKIDNIDISWSVKEDSNNLVSLNKISLTKYGATFTPSSAPKTATLVASYSYKGQNYTKDVIINLVGSTLLDIKDVRNCNDFSAVYASGIIVAFASETLSSSETSKRMYKGVVVKDLETNDLITLDGLEYYLDQTYPDFIVDEEELEIGTIISFKGVYIKDEERVTLLSDDELYNYQKAKNDKTTYKFKTSLNYVSESNVVFNDDEIIYTVHNQNELSNAVYMFNNNETQVNYSQVIKLVGTKANPIYFTPTSSNEAKSSGKMNFRIHFNSKATSSPDTMFDGHSITIKQDNQGKNVGEDNLWYKDLGLPDIGTSGNMYPGCMAFTGAMYITIVYSSQSSDGINCFYNSCSIINYENWSLVEFDINSSIEYGDN